MDNTATASINVGENAYFDNETILSQFQCLFKMLEFKADYRDHEIYVLVDNARTHMARPYNLNDFGKGINSRCPIEVIEYYDDNEVKQVVECYFSSGPHKNKSKGLLQLAKELNIVLPTKYSLSQLREIFSRHPALETVNKLFFSMNFLFFF